MRLDKISEVMSTEEITRKIITALSRLSGESVADMSARQQPNLQKKFW